MLRHLGLGVKDVELRGSGIVRSVAVCHFPPLYAKKSSFNPL